VVTLFNGRLIPCRRTLRMMETMAPPRRGPRCLGFRWFVAVALAVRLLAQTAGEAWAQASLPSGYDDRTDSVTAPASRGVTGQPRASLGDPFEGWDKVQKHLDNCGVQMGIRYDADIFSDLSALPDATVDVVTTRSVLIYVAAKRQAFAEF